MIKILGYWKINGSKSRFVRYRIRIKLSVLEDLRLSLNPDSEYYIAFYK
jgi:hypothetical protein